MGKRGGQPPGTGSRYTIVLSELICADLSNGKPLRQICREIDIQWSTIYRWRKAYPDFDMRFEIARSMGEEALAAECLDIADDTSRDFVTTDDGPVFDKEHVQRSKLRIETRLKLLAKWNPKKWGDKIEQTHKGDANAPVQLVLQGSDIHG